MKARINYILRYYLLLGSTFHKVYPIVCACQQKITNGFQIRDEDVIGYWKRTKNRINIFVSTSFLIQLFYSADKKESAFKNLIGHLVGFE